MKFKKTKKRLEVPAETKPKRVGLNTNQKVLLSQIKNLSWDQLTLLLSPLLEAYGLKSVTGEEVPFYRSSEVSKALGWSEATVEKYHFLYHRIVRRAGESAKEFRLRKASFSPAQAPLLGDERGISPAALLFIALAPTQLKGGNKSPLKAYRTALSGKGFRVGKAKKIGKNVPVTSWVTEPSKEVTFG